MFKVDINKYIPKFIMNDKNGYAVAKAIEKALQLFNDKLYESLNNMNNINSMPEWRLDEIAWETQCFYDYNADIEKKRIWIKDSFNLYRKHGTKNAMLFYIYGYFDDVKIMENWEYGGEPYHFQIITEGEWSAKTSEWLSTSIEQSKNARSVVDFAGPGTISYLGFTAISKTADDESPKINNDLYPGTWPENGGL